MNKLNQILNFLLINKIKHEISTGSIDDSMYIYIDIKNHTFVLDMASYELLYINYQDDKIYSNVDFHEINFKNL